MDHIFLLNINNYEIVPVLPNSFIGSIFSLLLAGLFGWLISVSYKYSSGSIYGGRQISSSLLPLTLVVCIIITVVKSSLALSLGLVGALSIVRFRTPIKDPEDLIYLFLSIVTGLGFGANQDLFTSLSISSVLLVLSIRSYIRMKRKLKFKHGTEFNLNLEWDRKNKISITELIDIISNSCSQISIIRFDQSKTQKNLILYLSLSDRTNIEEILDKINTFRSDISAQFYDASIEY